MGTANKIRRAQTLIENEGDPVTYRGVRWFYLRTMTEGLRRSVKVLEAAGKLKRWSEKTPSVVQILE